jgi:CheY-like chemotaxis protein
MLWMLFFLFVGMFLGLIIFALLYQSSKEEEFKPHHRMPVINEQDQIKNFHHRWSNIICLGTGTKRIESTMPKISKETKRILFVDDEELLVDLVARMLRHLGYVVVALNSSLEALDYMKSEKKEFDLIIVDQVLPVLSGTEFAKEAHRLQPEVPVILFTGFSDTIVQEELTDIGIQEIVAKPINLSDLSQVINRMLSFSKTEQPSISLD